MATLKPRITVTLEPHAYEVVSRLSKANGESMSAIVTGLVDLAVPSFERVVVVLERAASASEEVKAGMRAALDRADRDVFPQMLDAVGQGDMFLAGLGAELEAAGSAPGTALPAQAPTLRPKRARRGPAGGLTPVPVTRGSGAVAGGNGEPSGKRSAGLVSDPTSDTRSVKATRKGRRGG